MLKRSTQEQISYEGSSPKSNIFSYGGLFCNSRLSQRLSNVFLFAKPLAKYKKNIRVAIMSRIRRKENTTYNR
jgi:hypothetical protein